MTASLARRMRRAEQVCAGQRRTHLFFQDPDETDDCNNEQISPDDEQEEMS